MSDRDAAYWIATLGLAAHPEGGYFAETYRAALLERFPQHRALIELLT